MTRRTWLAWAALVCLATTARPAEPKPAPAQASKKDPAGGFFGPTRVHKVHLHFSAAEWGKMQPAPPRFGFGGPGAAPKAPAGKPADTHRGAGFGTEFPWVRGAVTLDGKTL